MGDSSPVCRDLMCATLLAAAGVAATAAGGPAWGIIGVLATGAAGNLFHDAFKATRDWYAEWTAGPEGIARNFDLTALAARAIRGIAQQAADDFTGHAHGRTLAQHIASLTEDHWNTALRQPGFEDLGDDRLIQFTGARHGGLTDHAATGSVWADLIKAALLAADANAKIDTLTGPQVAGLAFTARRLWERFPAQFNGELRSDPKHGGRALVAVQLLLANRTREEIARVDETVRTGTMSILDALDEAAGRLRDRLKRLEDKHDVHEAAEAERHAILEQQNRQTHQNQNDHQRTLDEVLKIVKANLAAAPATRPTPKRTTTSPTNIPDLEPHWLHRKSITDAIHRALTTGAPVASLTAAVATAAGGYGKTIAARLYAHEHAGDYPGGRFELKMEGGDLQAELASLLPRLDPSSALLQPEAAKAVKAMLESPPLSLLILDNIKSLSTWQACVNSGLLPGGACRVLITTQRAEVLPECAVEVPRFSGEEAWTILATARPDALDVTNREWVGRALRAADGLGVALGAIASRMKAAPGLSWNAYWAGLQGRWVALFTDAALPPLFRAPDAQPEASQQARWNALLDDCYDALVPAERRVIDYAALLPADMVPKPWLLWLMQEAEGGVGQAGTEAIVERLIGLELLTPGPEGGQLLGLHRQWRRRLEDRAGEMGTDRTPLLLAIAACIAARKAAIIGTAKGHSLDTPAIVSDPDAAARRWELAPLAQTAVALAKAGQQHAAAGVVQWLANPLRLLGRFAEARAALDAVLTERPGGGAAVEDTDLAALLNELATIRRAQGDLPGARASMERAIAINQKHFAPDHPTLATSWSNLALIQQDQGDLPGARASMERAIAIEQSHFPPDHPTLAVSYSNLATIQKDHGDLPGARAGMERAIAIKEKHFAPDHPTFATSYSNLATIQKDQGDLPGARASLERAIAILSKHLAADHPNFGTAYSNLALIQQAQGDLPGARASMERAIAIKEKHFAPDHPTFGISYTNLATFCNDEGDRAAACANFKKALAIFLKHFDEHHPHVKTVREWMAVAGCGG